jgi:lysozyme
MRISRRQAERILKRDVERIAADVARLLGDEVMARLNANQFGALTSFAFNVGIGNFRRSSVLRAVRQGRLSAVPRLLLRWSKARDPRTGRLRTLRGLLRRRRAEGRLWLTPPGRRHPPPVAVARHKAQELKEVPSVAAAWAAFLLAVSGLFTALFKEITTWFATLF